MNKKKVIYALFILIPLLLELLFFFRNDTYQNGLKHVEKYIALLSFVLFILGHSEKIRVEYILKRYCILFTLIISILFLRFLLFYPEQIKKYLNGIDLWEVGYVFTKSFKVHATALNMQLVFVSCCALYFLLQSIKKATYKSAFLLGLILLFSFILILIINTRIALILTIIGYFIIIIKNFNKSLSLNNRIIILLFTIFAITTVIKIFISKNPYMIEKYSTVTFAHLDKIGRLDEIDKPESTVYNALVTRLSIWKSAYNLGIENAFLGVGSSNINNEMINYYKKTNQFFLAKYKLITHNQLLNYFVKFGIFGIIAYILYFYNILIISQKSDNILVYCFFIIFLFSNITDDFLNRFDGIAFSGFFISLFYTTRKY